MPASQPQSSRVKLKHFKPHVYDRETTGLLIVAVLLLLLTLIRYWHNIRLGY